MLEVNYKSFNGRLAAKFSGNDIKDVVRDMAKFEEIFCSNVICGHCESDDTRFQVRDVEGNSYFERLCNACHYSFSYGQKKKGNDLFPKTGKGWTKYTPPQDDKDA